MEDEVFKVDTMVSTKWKLFLAKLFGKKTIVREGDWGMTYYEWRGAIYVTEYHDYEKNYHI